MKKLMCLHILVMFVSAGINSLYASVQLDVAWISQLNPDEELGTSWDDTKNCGPTALVMAAHHIRNFRNPNVQDIKNLDNWLYENGLIGAINNYNIEDTSWKDLLAASAYYYGLWNVHHYNQNSLNMLESYLIAGHPVIVGVKTYMSGPSSGVSHFMLLTGIDNNYVYVNDPGRINEQNGKTSYPISTFLTSWATQNYCAIAFDNDNQVGVYANGWHDAGITSSAYPPSQPFVDYFLNNGTDTSKGPDFFGTTSGPVQLHSINGPLVQNFSSGYTLILNENMYSAAHYYMGVVYSIHGHIKDYWQLFYPNLGSPVTNEYFYPSGTENFVVQWFEPTENNYIAVIYDNREGMGGTYVQYQENDTGCPPFNQEQFDQDKIDFSGYQIDGFGMGGGGDPPSSDIYEFTRALTCKGVQDDEPWNYIGATSTFYNSDGDVYLWTELVDVYASVSLEWKWYKSDGNLTFAYQDEIPDPAEYDYEYWAYSHFYSYIEVGDEADFGQWKAEFYVNGDLISTTHFELAVNLAAPGNVSASAIGADQARISWSPVDKSAGYHIYRDGSLSATVAGTEYTDNTVIQGQSYSYRVKAVNGQYSSQFSNAITVAIPAPPEPPSNLQIFDSD